MKHWIRNWLGINEDFQNAAKDIQNLDGALSRTNEDVFAMFHAMPFGAGIMTMTAVDAAKFFNASTQGNSLITLLTAILFATRMGQSSLQVTGELPEIIRKQLEKRGFKVEEVQGSNDNKGLFILWT